MLHLCYCLLFFRQRRAGDVYLTRVYHVLSFFALCVVQLHTKPTTRRRTPVCHNSSQATALNPGRAETSIPNILLFGVQAISISNRSSLTSGDPGASKPLRAKDDPASPVESEIPCPLPRVFILAIPNRTTLLKHKKATLTMNYKACRTTPSHQHLHLHQQRCCCVGSATSALSILRTHKTPQNRLNSSPRPRAPSTSYHRLPRDPGDKLQVACNLLFLINRPQGRPKATEEAFASRVSQSARPHGKDVHAMGGGNGALILVSWHLLD